MNSTTEFKTLSDKAAGHTVSDSPNNNPQDKNNVLQINESIWSRKDNSGSGDHIWPESSPERAVRRQRPRNNSAAPMHGIVQRGRSGRLPPLDLSKRKCTLETIVVSGISVESGPGASCPTDYLKRLRQNMPPKNPEIEQSVSKVAQNTIDHTVRPVKSKTDENLAKPAKLKPVKLVKRLARATNMNASFTMDKNLMCTTKNRSNAVQAVNPNKRKISNFNMKNVGDAATPVSTTNTGTVMNKDDQGSTGSTPNRSTELITAELEPTTSETIKHPTKSKTAEELEELASRDRYLSVMEEMLKKHKGLSSRTNRTPTGMGGNSSSVVPSRRIQPLAVIPEDPMMRFTGRHVFHSMGFKLPEKSESMVVEPDYDQIRQAALLQECENMLQEELRPKTTHTTRSTMRTETMVRPKSGSIVATKTTELELHPSWENSSLESLASETESVVSNAEGNEAEGELSEDAERRRNYSDRTSDHRLPQIDPNRIYFHFNPVVQIYPNQTPWRVRSTIRSKTDHQTTDTEVVHVIAKSDFKKSSTTHLTDDDLIHRRPLSAEPILLRSMSADKFVEMRQAFQSIRRNRTSSSSLSDLQTFSSLSDYTEFDEHRARIVRSASDGPTGLNSVTMLSTVVPVLTESVSLGRLGPTDRSIITQGRPSRHRGSLSIHENVQELLAPSAKHMYMEELPGMQNEPAEEKGDGTERVDEDDEADQSSTRMAITGRCEDVLLASGDPNPMTWFDILDERLANCTQRTTFREKLIAQFRLKGLQKRFVSIPHGMYGLQRELEKGWDIRPKPELLMSCVVKHHVLKMPLSTPNPQLVEKIYTNSIVRYPLLYKLIMRRREILPQELQQFLNRIMEMTETSDRMLASITSSTTKLTAVTTAAKEMDASGFMTGGPKLKQNYRESRSSVTSINRTRPTRASTGSRTAISVPSDLDVMYSETPEGIPKPNPAKKDAGFCTLYAKETDFDKGFYTVLRNPCTNILEEVALHNPEFAWHVRPLFEHRWATLEEDLLERILMYRKQKNAPSERSDVRGSSETSTGPTVNSKRPHRGGILLQLPETLDYCKQLVYRVFQTFTDENCQKPGARCYTDLLICLHMTNYYTELGDILVKELDQWVPPLLVGLESCYSSVREDTCCILAYLVCSYRLITRLHVVSKNLLVANISFAILSAIGHYPESYAFYHGLLGYMLHALPCISTLDCLLLWLPSVQNNENNLVARDWSLYVYYVFRHWPRNPFYLDAIYQKKLLRPLETSYLTKHAKRTARLALSYLVRTCNVRSALLICWPENDDDVPLS